MLCVLSQPACLSVVAPLISARACVRVSAKVTFIGLHARRVWTDPKMVNAIATCVFSKDTKLVTMALTFFLGIAQVTEGEDKDGEGDAEKPKSGTLSSLYCLLLRTIWI